MPTVVLAPVHTKLLKTWTLLGQDATRHQVTGTTTETVLASVTVPAATMGPNGVLRITTLWSLTNNANNKTPRIKFGGVLFFENIYTASASVQHLEIIRNRNNQAIQVAQPLAFTGVNNSANAIVTATVDTTAGQTIQFTGQLGNSADTMAIEALMVEAFYGA